MLRTALLSALAVLVFGALFASADAIVGSWVDVVVPDVEGSVVLRVFVMVAVGGSVLAASYLALNPPTVDHRGERRPAQNRFEWLAPVLLVDAVFVLFLAAQAAAVFGGHDYVQRVTGLTYAEYVHQGFAQLTLATALTLLVVWAAARKAGPSRADRWWLMGSLGGLCLLTLVVVASALHRMDAVPAGLRLHPAAAARRRLRGLARAGRRGGAPRRPPGARDVAAARGTALRRRGAARPRRRQPRRVDRAAQHRPLRQATGKVDWAYLQGLSADAVPTLAEAAAGGGVVRARRRGARGGHAGRAGTCRGSRARDVLAGQPVASTPCP